MIIVSDTGPLTYLVEIEAADLLPALFGRVLAPPAVIAELSHPSTPERTRLWIAKPPKWLEVLAPQSSGTSRLGPGETEAISLAQELHAHLLLIDERDGTRIARELGLTTTGTLGVLDIAAERGLISLPSALERLKMTNFRRSEELFQSLLAKDRGRQGSGPGQGSQPA